MKEPCPYCESTHLKAYFRIFGAFEYKDGKRLKTEYDEVDATDVLTIECLDCERMIAENEK